MCAHTREMMLLVRGFEFSTLSGESQLSISKQENVGALLQRAHEMMRKCSGMCAHGIRDEPATRVHAIISAVHVASVAALKHSVIHERRDSKRDPHLSSQFRVN